MATPLRFLLRPNFVKSRMRTPISSFHAHAKLFSTTRLAPRHSSSMQPIFTKEAMARMSPSLFLLSLALAKSTPAVGPYSQAIITSPGTSLIFVSGQLPATADGLLVLGSMQAKTAACINALAAILEEAGSSLDKIVKVQIFLTDMRDFEAVNEVYGQMITHKPARSCVQVAALPKGVDVEIECVAMP